MITYEELLKMASEGDPLYESLDEVVIGTDAMIIFGNKENNVLDLKIKIEENGFRVWVRDPLGSEEFVGQEWCHEAFFKEYSDLVIWVTWIYSW